MNEIASMIVSALPFVGNVVNVHVHVADEFGAPISNALVQVGTLESNGDRFARSPRYKTLERRSDAHGDARFTYASVSGRIRCMATAEGCYPEEDDKQRFASSYSDFTKVVLSEHSKDFSFTLRRKKNPIPMYASSTPLDFKLPFQKGFWGFDLKAHDWIAPYGKGKVADFSIEYAEEGMADGLFSCTGAVVFAGLDGAYVMKKNKSKAFWSVHEADTNAVYAQRFPFYYFPAEDGSKRECRHDTINEDEYLVMRTRVETDASGNVKSANYSKIYGPFLVGRGLRFRESCFNPTPNDPNIEFDVRRNLFKKPHGSLVP